MTNYFRRLKPEHRDLLEKRAQPKWTAPILARFTDERFSDPVWISERKFDGGRALAFRSGDRIRLMTRNKKAIGDTYPKLVDAFADQRRSDFIVDGEIVAFEGSVTSFSRLQQRMQIKDPEEARASGIAVHCCLFDVLHLDGHDVTALALRTRKSFLKGAIDLADPLRFSAHRNEKDETYFKEACTKGWEGIIAKRADSRYEHKRSGRWLKFKRDKDQGLMIGGFTEPKSGRTGVGALLVGYYEGKKSYATPARSERATTTRRCFAFASVSTGWRARRVPSRTRPTKRM